MTAQLEPDQSAAVVKALRLLREHTFGGNASRLAALLGISQPGLSTILHGKNRPGFRTSTAAAKVLGCTLDQLFAGEYTIVRAAPKPATPRAGVYFIEDTASSHIKIGFSTDAGRRLVGLQTASSSALRMLAVMPGEQADERSLHRLFAHLRTRGEWFQPGPDLLTFIANLGADQVAA